MRHGMGAFRFPTQRSIRLDHDYADMKAFKKDSTILDFEAVGDPPEKYIITFNGKSLVPGAGGKIAKIGGAQQVELTLGADYPRHQPQIEWLTPIVHPNISGGNVCLGNYANQWTPYFKLVDMLEILWDYSRMAVLNPHGGYRQEGVTTWDKLRRDFNFPVDRRPLRDKVFKNDEGSSIVRPSGDEFDIEILDEPCS
jgi:ubiquitin-protein ligase